MLYWDIILFVVGFRGVLGVANGSSAVLVGYNGVCSTDLVMMT